MTIDDYKILSDLWGEEFTLEVNKKAQEYFHCINPNDYQFVLVAIGLMVKKPTMIFPESDHNEGHV